MWLAEVYSHKISKPKLQEPAVNAFMSLSRNTLATINIQIKNHVRVANANLTDHIAQHTDISKIQIKKTLTYGGCWLKKSGAKKAVRCRKAKQQLNAGDFIEFYYDQRLVNAEIEPPLILRNSKDWGVWYKPPNMVSQGSKYGDLHSMENQVQKLSGKASSFLIHRLDREASGLMVFAYTKRKAAELSEIWRSGVVEKIYQVEVLGTPAEAEGIIAQPLDDKQAETRYRLVKNCGTTSLLAVQISTGRYHQIRRHMALMGHPVMGDPKYGQGNKNKTGMRLVATKVAFEMATNVVECELPAELRLF